MIDWLINWLTLLFHKYWFVMVSVLNVLLYFKFILSKTISFVFIIIWFVYFLLHNLVIALLCKYTMNKGVLCFSTHLFLVFFYFCLLIDCYSISTLPACIIMWFIHGHYIVNPPTVWPFIIVTIPDGTRSTLLIHNAVKW